MRPAARIGIVAGGYVAALLVALFTVWIYVTLTDSPEKQASSGMNAFSESLLFLAVLGIASVPSTGAALYFLRQRATFWRALCVIAGAMAAMGAAASATYILGRTAPSESALGTWVMFSILRVVVGPLFILAFFVATLFAPTPGVRVALAAATSIEAVAFGCVVLMWFAIT